MTAFPSGSSNHIPTTNLDQSTDKPKNARADLLALAQRMNTIIDSFNASSGICGLNGSAKIDSNKITGKVINSSFNGAVVKTDNLVDANNTDAGVTGAKIRDNTITTAKLSQVSTDVTMGGNSPSNSLIPTQQAVSTFVGNQVGADEVKYILKATETLFFRLGVSNSTLARVGLTRIYSSHANFHARIEKGQGNDLLGSDNDTEWDVLHNTYPIAGGASKNFTCSNSNDTIVIHNDGTYVFEFGYQSTWGGDDNDDRVNTNEGYDFEILDQDDNVLHLREIRGNGNSATWGVGFNFRITLAFSGAGTNANKIHFKWTRVGDPDGWSGGETGFIAQRNTNTNNSILNQTTNTSVNPYYCYLYQTGLTTAMNNTWG